MVKIGDRYRLPVTYSGEWRDSDMTFLTGKVIAVYPRFAVVEFPSGMRECYPFYGPQNIA